MPLRGFGFKSEAVRAHGKVKRVHDVSVRVARLPRRVAAKMAAISRHAAEVLDLRGYAKIDLRMDDRGGIFVIEANAKSGPVVEESDLAPTRLREEYSAHY